VVRAPGYRFRGTGFYSWRYQIFWEVVDLERGSFSLVSTTEELLGRNSSCSGLENREYSRGNPLRWPRDTLYPQKLALTSPTSGGRSVGIVCLRTKATEFFKVLIHATHLFNLLCMSVLLSMTAYNFPLVTYHLALWMTHSFYFHLNSENSPCQ
jgi:hypothetical protein